MLSDKHKVQGNIFTIKTNMFYHQSSEQLLSTNTIKQILSIKANYPPCLNYRTRAF